METRFRNSRLTSQPIVASLLLVFIALSLFAMFTTSKVGDEMKWLGMKVVRLDAETRAARGIPTNVGGVLVEGADGIAARAGVRAGDVIVTLNGNRVQDLYDFLHYTGETDISKGGAQIDVLRNGSRMPVFIFPSDATAQVPGQAAPAAGVAGVPLAISPQWLGIEADTVRAGDVKELGLPAGAQGVAVDAVTPGSRAEQAGLISRDVVVAVNGQRINSANGLWNALAGLNGADPVELGVYRNGQLVSVVVPATAPAGAIGAAPAGGFGGRMGGMGLGPGGILVCPNCQTTVAHQRGVPCFTVACPACGTTMVRTQ